MFVRALTSPLRRQLDRWLFRLGVPEPLPIRLHQRRIFVLPTSAGVAFGIALMVMLLAAINYNLSLGYALVFLLAGTGLVSIFHAFRNLLNLSLTGARCEAVHAGETAVFRFTITNPSGVARPALTISARARSITFNVPEDEDLEVDLHLPTTRRGWLDPGRVQLETHYPLGLIRAWSVFRPRVRCLVYPRAETDPPPLPDTALAGDGAAAEIDGDDDFAGLRAYRASDSPRQVAWKSVARGGPLVSKRFSGVGGGELTLDWHVLPESLDIEEKLSRLTAWVLTAQAAGLRFALRLPNAIIEPGSGAAHTRLCLEKLALLGTGAR